MAAAYPEPVIPACRGRTLWLHLAPLLLPWGVLFCGGATLTLCQSLGVFTPLPYSGGWLDAYKILFSDPLFRASAVFSLWVAAASALLAVAGGTFLALRIWRLPRHLAPWARIYKIPLILPHIAVAFVILVFWSQSGILASLAHTLGLIRTQTEFPNVLYSGWGLGMILAYTLKGMPFAMILILALLARFDPRQIQTAHMLGASRARICVTLLIPALAPALHTGFVILFLYALGAFDIPWLLGESRPGMLSIRVYDLYFHHDLSRRPEAMAILSLMFAFAWVFILLYGRAFQALKNRIDPG